MKKITLWIFVLFASIQLNAQIWTINSCSTLGTTTYGPMYSTATANANNRTAVIYPSSQLTTLSSQVLNSMYFLRNTATGSMAGTPNFKIYLKEVTATDWGTSTIDWATETTGATLVYDSNPAAAVGSDAGWKSFSFTTNFTYSGTQNLAVFFEYSNSTASSSISWNYEYTAPCSDTSNNNTTKYNNNTTGNLSATLGSSNYRRPLIGFDFVVSCNAPNTVATTNVGATTADISWIENTVQPQNGYEYYNSTSNTAPTPTETPTGTTANGVTSLSLSTLSSATTYYFWVRGNCGATDKSIWVGPLSYTTSCVPFSTPYNENFDGLALVSPYTDLPNCWEAQTGPDFWDVTNDITNAGNTYSPDVGDHTTGSGNYMWIDSSTDITANEMVSPLIDMTGLTAPYAGFWLLSGNTNNAIIHTIALDVWDGAAWLNIATETGNFSNWIQVASAVPSSVPTITKFRIYAIANPNGTTSDYYFNDLGVDDFFVMETPACPFPNSLTASNVTSSSAILGWSENGTATSWNIEYGPVGFTQGTGGTLVSGITANPYTLTALNPATAYSYYVQSDCGVADGVSAWSGPFSFLTECVEIAAFVENFDTTSTGSGNLPVCWSKEGTSNNVYVNTGANAPMSPANRLYMNISATTTAFAVMPPVSNLQANTHRLKFKTYCTSANKVLSIGYFTTPGDETTYVEIEPIQLPSTALASTQEFTIIPTTVPSGVNQLVFNLVAGLATTAYIDDVKWEVNSSCVEPNTLTASAITNNGATLGWTNGGSETTWDIQYGISGFALGTGTMVNGTTTNPHVISGLTANTNYEFYVRGVCTGPENSSWAGPFAFKTQCDDVTDYAEDFEPYATGSANPLPDCWNRLGTGFTYITTGSVAPMSPAKRLYMSASGTTPTQACAVLPAVSNLQANTHRLKFKGYATSANEFVSIGYLTDPSNINTFIQITEVFLPGTTAATAQEFIIQPTGIPAGVKHLAILNPGSPAGTTVAYIDDVIWEAIPACPSPTTLMAANLTSSTADLSWTEMGSATLWNVEYGPVGYTQGTGGTAVSGVTTNPYTLSGLTPATSYDYYVQADCGGTDGVSIWVGPFTFTTECITFNAPFTEGFENAGTIPNCWSMSGGEDWKFSNSGSGSHIGDVGTITGTTATNNYFAWVDDSSPDFADVTLTSPLINSSTLTAPRLTFYELSNNEGQLNSTLAVEVWDGAAWNSMAQYNTNTSNGWEKKIISLSSLTITGDIQVRFTFIGSTSFYDDIAIDDVTIEETPACIAPTTLVATAITSTSASLGWTEMGSATLWNLEYGPTGFTQGTGGTVVSGVSTNPYSLTGIASSTTFDYYVQSDCGGTSGTSTWTGPFTFTTECAVFTAPFTEGFESAGNLPNCWTNTGTSDTWQFNNAGTGHIGNAGTITGTTTTGNYFAWVDDSGSTSPDVTLTSPLIDVSSLTLPRLTFFELSNNEGFLNAELNVSVWDGAAWNPMAMYNTNTIGGWEKKTIDLSTLTITGPIQVRFVVTEQPSDFYDDIAIDDVTIDESPSTPPTCTTNFVATPNTSCGNDPTVITWDAAALADGYYMTMGTTAGGNDVLNNVNIGAAPTYSHIGAPNTTYYYTVSPFNASGTATGCTEQSFMTIATGCYCTSVPSSLDNSGITNVQLGTTDFPTGVVTYFDHSATSVSFAQGASSNVMVSFATGYTYGTNIWIDFNDDYNFDASEIVFTGESLAANPTVFDATFIMPTTAALGSHKMRIGTADTGQATPNPCYSGSYGVTLDFTVNVTPLLSTDNFDNASFVAYPNPVRDVLNLSYSSDISSVKVINLLGQIVISKKVENSSTQLDMSSLSAGTYIVNVTIDDIIKTIKVIKQ